MKVDEKATARARELHAAGERTLDRLFGFTFAKASLNPQTGRRIGNRAERRAWREWRDKTFPARVKRRRRRKLARAMIRRQRSRA